MADYLTAPDLIARMEEHAALRRRGLTPESRVSCVEPVVVPRHAQVLVPESLLMQGGYGTEEELLDYLKRVNHVPMGAEVHMDADIALRTRHVRFEWWEVQTWEEKDRG